MKTGNLLDLCEHIRDTRDKVKEKNIVVDGLFLTKEVQDTLSNNVKYNVNFIYFKPDVANCLYNDSLRDRKLSSAITIKNSRVNKPRRCVQMTVKRYDYITLLKDEHKFDDVYNGEEWSNGGTVGTCYDENGPHEIKAGEVEPMSDLTRYYPVVRYFYDLTDDEIFNKFSHLIEEDEYTEHDYYGGAESRSFYYMNTRLLIEYILRDLHGLKSFDTKYVKEFFPELIL
jgi:hypothetical protein